MSELPLYKDQVLKAEQYKDLLREAEQHRRIKAVTQLEPKRARGADVSRLEALVTYLAWGQSARRGPEPER
jgi:hypothetical protein